ncbi:TetR/AcrR family transcriptional regulator [Kitasatospora purpeofusca]|uniref:TetR/AcrR family transcriptional regulator n=1 Tax=Kitasatospora purpeofusca TaxID=67352 RepID=UPI0036D2F2E3
MNAHDTAVDLLLAHGPGPQPRADARRNVAKLVAAAREAIADIGVEAATAHEIARRAGVGVGTFYRRIPSREVLLEAVLTELLTDLVTLARTALAAPDPWTGFRDFAAGYVRLRTRSCGINEALGGSCGIAPKAPLADLREQIRLLVDRTHAAGVLRPDVTWQDVPFLLAGVATAARTIGLTADDHQWERNLHIILDGLSTARPNPLPPHRP